MKPMVPTEFYLSQNYPNPFNERTTIKFCVPHRSWVRLDILDPETRTIRGLLDEEVEPGTYEVNFDGSDLSEGTYVCLFQSGEYVSTKRMLLKR